MSCVRPHDWRHVSVVKGTTLIHGGNSPTWTRRKRKRLNGKAAPFIWSPEANDWTCTDLFNFPLQSRWEEMDWKAESSVQSSEEEGGDEQNADTRWYRSSTHCQTSHREEELKPFYHKVIKQPAYGNCEELADAGLLAWLFGWFFPDTAYSCDPRIKKFKDDEKARKESEKKAKAEAKKREQDEKDRVSAAATVDYWHSVSLLYFVVVVCYLQCCM